MYVPPRAKNRHFRIQYRWGGVCSVGCRLRRVVMGHENFDDMCERYQDAKAAGDNVDDPKVFYKPERPPK